jgi:uncharacterized protein involved in exopolysaccharide biosynthesis
MKDIQENREQGDLSALDLMIALAKHRKLLIRLPLAVAVLAVGLSLVLPKSYKATTKILPPQQAQSSAAALLTQLGGVTGMAAGMAGLKSPNDMYVGMLKSRTVADRLIARFNLKSVYDVDLLERARVELEGNTSITSGKDGLISIQVEGRDQKMVAPLANAYVEELVNLTKTLAVTEAAKRRLFFEQQLERSKNNLAAAESKLKGALDNNGVISVDAESRTILETVSRVRAQISAKEIQLASMRAFVTATNPQYLRVQEELRSLRAELTKLENGRGSEDSSAGSDREKSGLANIQVLRDVKYHQMLYELLAKQYEAARLDEAKDAAIIQVLDVAVEPERKFKPKRAIIVIVSTLLALFAAMLYALISEAKHRALQSPANASRWRELRDHLRSR